MKIDIIQDSDKEIVKADGQVNELKADTPVPSYQFPSNVSGKNRHSSYLIFSALKVDNSMVGHSSQGLIRQNIIDQIVTSLVNIALPMPQDLNEKTSHSYSDSSTSAFAQIAGSLLGGDYSSVGSSLDSLSATGGVVKNVAYEHITKSDSMARLTGKRTKQNNTAMYQTSKTREQNFRYLLTPKNKAEHQQIGKLLHAFQVYSAATYDNSKLTAIDEDFQQKNVNPTLQKVGNSSSVYAPPLWMIVERFKDVGKRSVTPFYFFPCVLTDIQINKTPNQQYQSMSGSSDPYAIELSLTFKETISHDSSFINRMRNGL